MPRVQFPVRRGSDWRVHAFNLSSACASDPLTQPLIRRCFVGGAWPWRACALLSRLFRASPNLISEFKRKPAVCWVVLAASLSHCPRCVNVILEPCSLNSLIARSQQRQYSKSLRRGLSGRFSWLEKGMLLGREVLKVCLISFENIQNLLNIYK